MGGQTRHNQHSSKGSPAPGRPSHPATPWTSPGSPPDPGPLGLPWLVGIGIFGVNLALRWGAIAHPEELVFDELYYVSFALDYLGGEAPFDLHPPLGKGLIAASIALFYHLAPGGWPQGEVTAAALNPWSYRWLNGVLGAALPLVVGWATAAWTVGVPQGRRHSWILLAIALTSLDGLALVESRLALLHPALWLAGWVALAAWGQARQSPYPHRWRLVTAIALGLAVGVKWNGAAYGVALGAVSWRHPWGRGGDSSVGGRTLLWALIAVPLLVYGLLWWPHLHLGQGTLGAIHHQVLTTHWHLSATHPYESRWYQWPLGQRPMAYFYASGDALGHGPGEQRAIALYGLGNPVLWWMAAAAMVPTLLRGLRPPRPPATPDPATPWLRLLVLVYGLQWLPWAGIQRATFIYHYQPAILAAEVALAGLMAQWFTSRRPSWRWGGGLLLGLIVVSFTLWLPLWWGWPVPLDWWGWRWL